LDVLRACGKESDEFVEWEEFDVLLARGILEEKEFVEVIHVETEERFG
jgi:hypothetical protein